MCVRAVIGHGISASTTHVWIKENTRAAACVRNQNRIKGKKNQGNRQRDHGFFVSATRCVCVQALTIAALLMPQTCVRVCVCVCVCLCVCVCVCFLSVCVCVCAWV